jgi:hypothetical protein
MEGSSIKWILASLLGIAGALCVGQTSQAREKASVGVSVSVPVISQIRYFGDQRLSFDLSDDDIARGYEIQALGGRVEWGTNQNHWRIAISRSAWRSTTSTPGLIDLQVNADSVRFKGGDVIVNGVSAGAPLAWHAVGETATAWVSGSDSSTGALEGVRWRVTNFDAGLQPGVYETTVYFSLSEY